MPDVMNPSRDDPHDLEHSRFCTAIILILVTAFVALSLFAGLGIVDVWGVSFLTIIPQSLMIALVILAAAFIWGSLFIKSGTAISFGDSCNNKKTNIYLTATSLLLAIVFVVLRSQNHLLGDGYTVLANVANPDLMLPTEPLTILATRLIYQITGNTELAFVILGISAGLLLLCIAYLYSRELTESSSLRAAGVLLFAGIGQIQFFFGYAENYTLMTASLAAFIYFGYMYAAENRRLLPALALFIIAGLFHLSAWFLLPGMLFLLLLKFLRSRKIMYAMAPVLTLGAAVALAVIFYGKYQGEQVFVPLKATAINPYSLFSGRHLSDLGNLLLLAAPMPLIALLACLPKAREVLTQPRSGFIFLLLCTVSGLVFSVMIDPKMGAVRDWDLLSLFSIPTAFLSTFCIAKSSFGRRMQTMLLFAAIAMVTCHSLPWVISNTYVLESKDYLKYVLADDPHYSPTYYNGYRLKSWSKIMWGDPYYDFEEVRRASSLRIDAYPDDNTNRVTCAYSNYLVGDFAKMHEVLEELDYTTLHPNSASLTFALHLRFGKLADAARIGRYGRMRFPQHEVFKLNEWVATTLITNPDEVISMYEKHVERSQATVLSILDYAALALNVGDYGLARSAVEKADELPEATGREIAEIQSFRLLIEVYEQQD